MLKNFPFQIRLSAFETAFWIQNWKSWLISWLRVLHTDMSPISFFSVFASHVAISMLSRQRDTSRFKYLSCNSTLRHVSLLRNGWLKKIYTIKLDAVIVMQREKVRY